MLTDDEFKIMPDEINGWKKSTNFKGYEHGVLCAMIQKDCICFGGYRPAGFNLGKVPYVTTADIINSLSQVSTFQNIVDFVKANKTK